MTWLKTTLGQGLEFQAIPTRAMNGTAGTTFVKGDLLVFDTGLSSSAQDHGAKNLKYGDPNSGWFVCVGAIAAVNDNAYYCVVDEDSLAPGIAGKVWVCHPELFIQADAAAAEGDDCSAGASAALDTTPPAGAKICAIAMETTGGAGLLKSAFNGIEGFGNPS